MHQMHLSQWKKAYFCPQSWVYSQASYQLRTTDVMETIGQDLDLVFF